MDFMENLFSNATATAAVIAALVSLVCSYITAQLTTRREMKKIEFAAKREDRSTEIKIFQDMVVAVTKCIYEQVYDFRQDAISAIAVARTIKSGYVGELLDDLRIAVAADDQKKSEEILALIYSNWINPEDL